MKRRGNGEATYWQRPSGTWQAQIRLEDDLGRRVRRAVSGKTKAETRDAILRLVNRRTASIADERETVDAYLNRWLKTISATSGRPLRPKTIRSYSDTVRLHLIPHLGHLRLSALTPTHVQKLAGKLEKDGVGARTRQLAVIVLRRALAMALRQGTIARNVATLVDAPSVPHAEMRFWTPEEVTAFLSAAQADRLYSLYVVALGTGMRLGELLALDWADVDIKEGTAKVRGTLDDATRLVGSPKTARSRRTIDLPPSVAAALKPLRKVGKSPVFSDTMGGRLRASNVHRRSFQPLMEAAGVPRIRFHDIRHTSVLLQRLAGVDWLVIARRIGHADPGFTMKKYGHLIPEQSREAALAIDHFLTR